MTVSHALSQAPSERCLEVLNHAELFKVLIAIASLHESVKVNRAIGDSSMCEFVCEYLSGRMSAAARQLESA